MRVFYEMRDDWRFMTKRLQIIDGPSSTYLVKQIAPILISLSEKIESTFTPTAYFPQFGPPSDNSWLHLSTRDFGTFLHLGTDNGGLMLLVQNPFLDVIQTGKTRLFPIDPKCNGRKSGGRFQAI